LNKINKFNIECKLNTTQTSPFVLLQDKDKKIFTFSKGNESDESLAENIIEHVNNNYSYYAKENSNKKKNNKLICPQKDIDSYVLNRLVRKPPIMVLSEFTDNFSESRPLIICYTKDITKYADITGTYRTKCSGTSAAKDKHVLSLNLDTKKINNEFFVYDPEIKIPCHHPNRLYLSKKITQEGYRQVKIKSNTCNSTIIFTLNIKKEFKTHTSKSFLSKVIDSYR